MKENVFDVLMYLFENYMDEAESNFDACVRFVRAVKDREYPAPKHCFS